MSPYIPPATVEKMKKEGISESEVLDVFNNGESGKSNSGSLMMVKKYTGYIIGLYYKRKSNTGDYVILTVWKHPRRK